MFNYFCVVFLMLVHFSAIYSQDVGLTNGEYMKKGNQIIENARKEIGIDKKISNLGSFQFSIQSLSDSKDSKMVNTEEIYVLLPDKIISVSSTTKPFESKSTSIWNGEKYKKLSEFVSPDGQRSVRDVTNSNVGNLDKFVKDKETLEKIKKVTTVDPKERLNNDLWNKVFPLILIHPFEPKAEFQYAGKAKSGDNEANVVDTTSQSGRAIRLLFDSKTNQLLLMIEKYKYFDGDYETKYFFSNRELVDNILIPKKIKVEHKFTPTGKDTKVSYKYIDVVEFKINPKFKPNLFDVN